ncbi:MAG: hypothetical protein JNK58_04205 [Phycisphaerae bacterium]|nr:hypothetical protein [Phycisphaerae bacterium]
MRTLPWTIFAGAIVGNDLHTATVAGSPLGVRAKAGPILRDFCSLAQEESRRLLGSIPDAATIVLVLPSSMVALRPTALPASRWGSAREEVLKSIESLFPFPASEAAVGFVGRRLPSSESAGYLVAADRRTIQPWLDAFARAAARPADAVISSHMAILGSGNQKAERVELLEWNGSQWSAHRLVWGEISELNASPSDAARERIALPSASAPAIDARTMTGADLAAAAALASVVAPDGYAPLVGRHARTTRRWLPAAAAILAGCALLWAVGRVEEWRYERAMLHLQAQRAERESPLAQVRAARQRATDLIARLESVRQVFSGGGSGALIAVDAVQASVPAEAFLYRIEVDPRTITVKGEARRAGDVLRAIEDAAEFQGARDLDTPITVEERGLEMFNIRAERRTPTSKGGAGG